jgi:hypothetical protein
MRQDLLLSREANAPPVQSIKQNQGTGGEGKRGGYASAKQNFPRKTGTAVVRDHGITTRRADAAEPSRCRRTRRG